MRLPEQITPKKITIVQLFSIVIIILSVPSIYYSYLLNKTYREVMSTDKSLSAWRFRHFYVDFSNLSEDKKALLKVGDQEIDNERHFIRAQILKIYNSDLNVTYAKIKLTVLDLGSENPLYGDKVLRPFTPFVFQTNEYKVEGTLLQSMDESFEFKNPYILKARLLFDTLPWNTNIQAGAITLNKHGHIVTQVLESHTKQKVISSIDLGNGFQIKMKKTMSTVDIELTALIKVGLLYDKNKNKFYIEYASNSQHLVAAVGEKIRLAIQNKWYDATLLEVEGIEKL